MKALITILSIFCCVSIYAQTDTLYLDYEKAEDAIKIDSILENSRNGAFQLLDSNFIETDYSKLLHYYIYYDTIPLVDPFTLMPMNLIHRYDFIFNEYVDYIYNTQINNESCQGVVFKIYDEEFKQQIDSKTLFYIKL